MEWIMLVAIHMIESKLWYGLNSIKQCILSIHLILFNFHLTAIRWDLAFSNKLIGNLSLDSFLYKVIPSSRIPSS